MDRRPGPTATPCRAWWRGRLAVLHAKKEAASLVDMFRGSNAIVGKADIVLGLWRDGSGDETTRTVEGMSRLDNGFDERTRIVREGREYFTSGTVREMELEARLQEYLDVLPTSREDAMTSARRCQPPWT